MSYIGPWYGPIYPRPLDPPDGEESDRDAEYERRRRELLEERAAIEAEAAKLRELYDALEGDQGGEATT